MSKQSQTKSKPILPPQHQERRPGLEAEMDPRPVFDRPDRPGCGKLAGKVALITGGDSGIGRAVAVAFAKEGADVAIVYLNEESDAAETKRYVEGLGRRLLAFAGDIGDESFCGQVVTEVVRELGRLDILVNNAAEQTPQSGVEQITQAQLEKTFRTNLFSFFYFVKAASPHLKQGSAIINTTSVTAYKGNEQLIDYSATKGAIVSFTRSLALSLVKRGIRVNGVAPGPIWTPLIPSTFPADQVAKFGTDTPMGRPGQPVELAPAYVFLASDDSSYMTGQILHVNGGEIVNG
ncbi:MULTISPECIES: SDR family oxidoreductase [Thermoactinomyces]|uniref:SDR family oxidoreductase n=1 Tax=Thermoactinomyces daqus TaxID=1329516 RepID=A0A7W1X7N9_9BACL|nr:MULTISPECIES: SDR family oxidoreductase [Thermoactinomyces]MBA4541494.1 SDR family oxidoreductase [Thermoactinomyces daqus]MBH8596970.1 SDR family oxidoreductase [Thermoactinomyces sp. CICC 10523]MBH8603746.1 SDR family oxidoreductase [Thermoactinomyces sp. CICC 10522]MBH8607619.1 SDR family oxidoreductase [Thermoactinomyces sp. CICC 10521]